MSLLHPEFESLICTVAEEMRIAHQLDFEMAVDTPENLANHKFLQALEMKCWIYGQVDLDPEVAKKLFLLPEFKGRIYYLGSDDLYSTCDDGTDEWFDEGWEDYEYQLWVR